MATPIGNLGDLSPRAREVLASVALIAAEDTRYSRRLLEHFDIKSQMVSLHEHNEASRVPGLIGALREGKSIALISDAGTPLLSDPGSRLVSAAAVAGITVSPIPGPAAAIAALSVAGLPGEHFWFEGFLPARSAARTSRLAALATQVSTLVFYVAPHRLVDDLRAMCEVLGADRAAVVARELTKIHESVYRGTLESLLAQTASEPMMMRGEIVLLVAGATEASVSDAKLDGTARVLLQYLSARDAAKVLSELTACGRNQAYAVIQRIANTAG